MRVFDSTFIHILVLRDQYLAYLNGRCHVLQARIKSIHTPLAIDVRWSYSYCKSKKDRSAVGRNHSCGNKLCVQTKQFTISRLRATRDSSGYVTALPALPELVMKLSAQTHWWRSWLTLASNRAQLNCSRLSGSLAAGVHGLLMSNHLQTNTPQRICWPFQTLPCPSVRYSVTLQTSRNYGSITGYVLSIGALKSKILLGDYDKKTDIKIHNICQHLEYMWKTLMTTPKIMFRAVPWEIAEAIKQQRHFKQIIALKLAKAKGKCLLAYIVITPKYTFTIK